MTPVRVIGTGSPNANDSSGWQLVDALRASGFEQQWHTGLLSVENCSTPAQLFPLINGCKLAILVDAAEGCTEAVQRLTVDDLAVDAVRCSVHGFGVAEALQLAARLAQPTPRIVLFGVNAGLPGADSEGDSLDSLPLLSAMIVKEVAVFQRTHPGLLG